MTGCDKSPDLVSMTILYYLNIRNVFDKAFNTIAEVLPDTPRMETAR